MKIIPNEENKEKLIELWVNVFGDEREYIELLFPYGNTVCDVFAVFDGDKISSALYLLDCSLTFNGGQYNGKYLYAAATDDKYRGRGLIASLIDEAQLFCKNSGIDFISLVPANEGLYNYYERFGFVTAMHRATVFGTTDNKSIPKYEISGAEYFTERRNRLENCIQFSGDSVGYVISCLEYSGIKFYKNGFGKFFITEKDSCLFDEMINETTAVRYVSDNEAAENKLVSEKFGMLYPIHSDLKRDWYFKDIYMNIALD